MGSTGAKAVQSQRKFVGGTCRVVIVLTARIQLAEDQLPVPTSLLFVVPKGNAAPEILYLNGTVTEDGHNDFIPVAAARLVRRVGKYFKKGMLTALKPV